MKKRCTSAIEPLQIIHNGGETKLTEIQKACAIIEGIQNQDSIQICTAVGLDKEIQSTLINDYGNRAKPRIVTNFLDKKYRELQDDQDYQKLLKKSEENKILSAEEEITLHNKTETLETIDKCIYVIECIESDITLIEVFTKANVSLEIRKILDSKWTACWDTDDALKRLKEWEGQTNCQDAVKLECSANQPNPTKFTTQHTSFAPKMLNAEVIKELESTIRTKTTALYNSQESGYFGSSSNESSNSFSSSKPLLANTEHY